MNTITTSLRASLRGVVARPPSARPFTTSFSVASSSGSSRDALDSVVKDIQAQQQQQQQQREAGANRNGPAARQPRSIMSSSSYRTSFGSMNHQLKPTTPEEVWKYSAPVQYSPAVTTTSARSFAVLQGNVARAYRNLNRVLNENNVRRELKRQDRFESPSNKRVRLNSERHRRRFKVAVGKAVSLAMRMKDL
ncbi:mitochondrial 37S ribosomal protein bS21m MRP21 [Sporobolomyces koalae]|uniref:mitochondrial 37S ribosomal protein bS21m MRP21 n=1 Tax=Sporobolomyces koalae TaxID=500713 RepID=UPI00316EA551